MMTPSTTLVIGATGNIGRHVVSQLATSGHPVRAVARRPRPEHLPTSVEYVRGDLTDPDSLRPALAGVEAVFLTYPLLTADDAPAVSTLLAKHARRVVYLSSNGVNDQRAIQSDPINQGHFEVERAIRDTGLEWTFLRSGGLAVNTLGWADDIRAGDVIRQPFPAAARSLIHEADIAAVAVKALTTPGHAGACYELTGPTVLTTVQQVEAIGEAIGRRLRVERAPLAEARQQFIEYGLPAEVADAILAAHAGFERNPEPVTATVEEVTGAPARTFQQWAADHADDFR